MDSGKVAKMVAAFKSSVRQNKVAEMVAAFKSSVRQNKVAEMVAAFKQPASPGMSPEQSIALAQAQSHVYKMGQEGDIFNPDTIAETAKDIGYPNFLANLGRDVMGISMAPATIGVGAVNLAKKVNDEGVGAGVESLKNTGDATLEAMKKHYGKIPEGKLWEFFEESPLGALMDVSMLGGGVGVLGKVAKGVGMARTGSVLGKVGKGIQAAVDVPELAARGLTAVAKTEQLPSWVRNAARSLVPEERLASPQLLEAMQKAKAAPAEVALRKTEEFKAIPPEHHELIERAIHGVEPSVKLSVNMEGAPGWQEMMKPEDVLAKKKPHLQPMEREGLAEPGRSKQMAKDEAAMDADSPEIEKAIAGKFEVRYDPIDASPEAIANAAVLNKYLAPWRKEVMQNSALFVKYGYLKPEVYWANASEYGHFFFKKAMDLPKDQIAAIRAATDLDVGGTGIFLKSKFRELARGSRKATDAEKAAGSPALIPIGKANAVEMATMAGMSRDPMTQYVGTPMLVETELTRLKQFEALGDPVAGFAFDEAPPVRGYAPLSDNKRFGRLAGKWIPEEDARILERYEKRYTERFTVANKIMRAWKIIHTAENPATWVNNLVGNTIHLAPMAGISPYNPRRWGNWKRGLQQVIAGKGDAIEKLYRAGKFAVDPLSIETLRGTGQLLRGFRFGMRDAMESVLDVVKALHPKRVLQNLPQALAKHGKEWVKFHGAQDNVFRVVAMDLYEEWRATFLRKNIIPSEAKALWGEEKARKVLGGDFQATADEAARAFVDGSRVSPFIETWSTSAIGAPFARFTAGVVPVFTEWMAKHPVRARINMILSDYFTKLSGETTGIGADKMDAWLKVQQEAAPYRGGLELPLGSPENVMNVGKYSPLFGAVPQVGFGAMSKVPGGISPFQNPLTKNLMRLAGYDPAFQREVKVGGAEFLGDLAGEMVPFKYPAQSLYAGATGQPAPFSKEVRTLGQAAASSLGGLKVHTVTKETAQQRIAHRYDAEMRDVYTEMKQAKAAGDDAKFEEKRAEWNGLSKRKHLLLKMAEGVYK